MNRNSIVIGTRGSDLARTQTGMVAEMIRGLTDIPVETVIIKTQGDRVQDIPLHQIDGKGFFTKELEEALMSEKIDLAVHSLKDLPTQGVPGLTVAAVPPRENPSDLLLIREDRLVDSQELKLPQGAVVGTSSKRRALQLSDARPDIHFEDLRGNVPTRINKMLRGDYDAIILAMAGYNRLSLKPDGYAILEIPHDIMLPAPGQGALAVQIRESDTELAKILSGLHHQETADAANAERHLLHLLGGGCALPLGVKVSRDGDAYTLRASLGPESWMPNDKAVIISTEVKSDSLEELPNLAHKALAKFQRNLSR